MFKKTLNLKELIITQSTLHVMKKFSIWLFMFCYCLISRQTQDEKLQERQNNKVEIFTSSEKDNLQSFVAEQVQKMNLTEDLQDDYYMIIGYHSNKMARLNDKDSNLTKEQIISKFRNMLGDMDKDVQEILFAEQFKIHKQSFDKIITSVYNRSGWEKG